MITDDERRRVAEKLRESIPGDGVMRRGDKGWSLLYRTIFGHYMSNQSAGRTYSEVAVRLADLIDPGDGQNEPDVSVDSGCWTKEGHCPDTGGHCPESRPGMSGIDRDALLALVDEMLSVSIGISSADSIRPLEAAYIVQGYARRIREACGEAVA